MRAFDIVVFFFGASAMRFCMRFCIQARGGDERGVVAVLAIAALDVVEEWTLEVRGLGGKGYLCLWFVSVLGVAWDKKAILIDGRDCEGHVGTRFCGQRYGCMVYFFLVFLRI